MMSNEIEHFFEMQDEATSLAFLQHKGDELTDILVAALEDALKILSDEIRPETLH
ncbi:hypothetical protein [Rhizobium mongolense]|uniref:hypothetical protein n=1 Tax=Rhizobium mongolense TaxID=57676 RepID=UPI0034A11C70